jgi:hypothetical protein
MVLLNNFDAREENNRIFYVEPLQRGRREAPTMSPISGQRWGGLEVWVENGRRMIWKIFFRLAS